MNAYDYLALFIASIAVIVAIKISFKIVDNNDHKSVEDDGTIRNIRMTDGGRMIDDWGTTRPKVLQPVIDTLFFWKLNQKKVVSYVDSTASTAFIDVLTKPDRLSSIDQTKRRII